MKEIIEKLKQQARDSWSGETGEQRAKNLENFLMKLLTEYSDKLDIPQEQILESLELKRTYTAINYYQEANSPSLDKVDVYETQEELLSVCSSKKFRCPNCEEISTNPYECNSGAHMKESKKTCDWKAYGLLGTLGKGYSFTIKNMFLDNPRVDNIFMPLEIEAKRADNLSVVRTFVTD